MKRRATSWIVTGLLLSWGLVLVPLARAHPLLQGSMDVEPSADRIVLRAWVGPEEVRVADAFAADGAVPSKDPLEAQANHGRYLLDHVRVYADGSVVPGRVANVIQPESATARIGYELEYDLPSPPARIRIEQNVLQGIEFPRGSPWEASFVVRITGPGGASVEGLLLTFKQPVEFSFAETVASTGGARTDRERLVRQYLLQGIEHILGGYDHLLFVVALVLATVTLWDLIKVVSAFTLAHTVTLTLSVLNVVRLPSSVVEPMIAASIVVVALSNVFWPKHSRGWIRLVVAFAFGLFHGLGFAGGLLAAMEGMAGLTIGLAIAAFSVGVELGHQMVVLPVFGALKLAGSGRDEAGRERLTLGAMRYGSAVIAVAGLAYLIAALHG